MFASWDGKQYVCFIKGTGEIFSVGPSIEDGYEYIEVTEKEIEPIKTYQDKTEDYRVVFNNKSKKYVLRKNVSIDNDFLFNQVPHISQDDLYDIIFKVDKTQNLCYISTNKELRESSLTQNILFSVTKKDDPHFLYQTVSFDIGDDKKLELKVSDEYSIYSNSQIAKCVYEEVL